VIDLRRKGDLGGLKGIVGGEVDVEAEDTAGKGRIGGSHDHAGPVIEIGAVGAATAATGRVLHHVFQFFFDTSESHCSMDCYEELRLLVTRDRLQILY